MIFFFCFAVGYCVFMFKLSWQLSMVTVIGLPVVMVVSKAYGNYYKVIEWFTKPPVLMLL